LCEEVGTGGATSSGADIIIIIMIYYKVVPVQLILKLFLELKVLQEAVVAVLAWLIVQLGGEGSETRRGCCFCYLTPILL
jgi:hypothetical protein